MSSAGHRAQDSGRRARRVGPGRSRDGRERAGTVRRNDAVPARSASCRKEAGGVRACRCDGKILPHAGNAKAQGPRRAGFRRRRVPRASCRHAAESEERSGDRQSRPGLSGARGAERAHPGAGRQKARRAAETEERFLCPEAEGREARIAGRAVRAEEDNGSPPFSVLHETEPSAPKGRRAVRNDRKPGQGGRM